MSTDNQKSITAAERPRAFSTHSFTPSLSSLRTPRTARFAEATSIHSPIEAGASGRTPYQGFQTNHYTPQPQPADIGFGYCDEKHMSVEMEEIDSHQMSQARTAGPSGPLSPPLKSAMKTPGAALKSARSAFFGPNEQFRDEEENLEKEEALTEKQQAQDLKVKTRVRVAKVLLRGINFSCSLIVLSMLATTFVIFNATKAIPPRNNLPPWAEGTNPWAQIVLLVIACISLAFSIVILGAYFRGGHRRAEKAAIYYTVFSVGFFVFSIVMWGIGAGILNSAKSNGNAKDLWGWSCKDNTRKKLFQTDVSYELICRLQNWSLVCCIIEIVVETITIAIYGIVFYRFYSKRKLRKSMAKRDTARSDLYLAQLRSQSAPNTPGFQNTNGPYSARDGAWRPPADYYSTLPDMEEGGGSAAGPSDSANSSVRYIDASRPSNQPKPFVLQPPPIKVQGGTPKLSQSGFGSPPRRSVSSSAFSGPSNTADWENHTNNINTNNTSTNNNSFRNTQTATDVRPQRHQQIRHEHFGATAPGERVYESVAIPGAYAAPLGSPTVAPGRF